jgi:hypothetical protein
LPFFSVFKKDDPTTLLAFILLILDHESVFGESCIDEPVDVDVFQGDGLVIVSSEVLLEVHFEDVFGVFGLVNFQILGQVQIELGKLTI